MVRKTGKKCVQCGFGYIFSKKLCMACWKKAYGKPVKKISDNYQNTLKEYAPVRKAFLAKHPRCQIGLEGCTYKAVCIHHKKGKHSKELYLDDAFYMASCISCNNKVETLGAAAYTLGLRIRHNSKE